MYETWPRLTKADWERLDSIKLDTAIEKEIPDDGNWAGLGFTRRPSGATL